MLWCVVCVEGNTSTKTPVVLKRRSRATISEMAIYLEASGASRARPLPQQKNTAISRRRASHPARKGLVCCCPIARVVQSRPVRAYLAGVAVQLPMLVGLAAVGALYGLGSAVVSVARGLEMRL